MKDTTKSLEEIRQLADEMRSAYERLLGGDTIAAVEELRVIVHEWNNDCVLEINQRIMQCHQLLKRGLRDEAIGYATDTPSLFDVVRLLDLERFGRSSYDAWMEAGKVAGIEQPAPLHLTEMDDLDAAQDWLEIHRTALAHWRRLNLERAPLIDRIKFLRKIAQNDTEFDVWKEMLHQHESHLLMDIKATVVRLADTLKQEPNLKDEQTTQRLQGLMSDLQGDWDTLTPPQQVFDQIQQLLLIIKQRQVDDEIDRLVTDLERTFGELDHDRSQAKYTLVQLLQAWQNALTERGVIETTDPRLDRVGAILAYAELVQKHESLLAEVENQTRERPTTLRARISWSEELDQMMDQVDHSATQLPPEDVNIPRIRDLSKRVASIADAVRQEERARRVLTVGGVAAVLLAIASVAWGVFSVKQFQDRRDAALASCDKLLTSIRTGQDTGQDTGETLGSAWPDTVRNDPAVIEALSQIESARQQWASDRTLFSQNLDALTSALKTLEAEARPDPLAEWPKSFTVATHLLSTIRKQKSSSLDAFAKKLVTPESILRRTSKAYDSAASVAFEDAVYRIQATVSATKVMVADDVRSARSKAEDAFKEITYLRALTDTPACPSASEGYGSRRLIPENIAKLVEPNSDVLTSINTLRSRCDIVAGLAQKEDQADRLLMDGKYAEYGNALRALSREIGSGPNARDYLAVASKHPQWQAFSEWQQFHEQLGDPKSLSATKAEALLARFEKLSPEVMQLQGFSPVPVSNWLKKSLEHFTENTKENTDGVENNFVRILTSRYGEEIDGAILEKKGDDDGQALQYPRYYCLLKDRPIPEQSKNIRYVTGLPDQNKIWPTSTLIFMQDSNLIHPAA